MEVLRRIALWLARSSVPIVKLFSLRWHQLRSRNETCRNYLPSRNNPKTHVWGSIQHGQNLYSNEALRNVVLGTTKWDEVRLEVGQQREHQLRDMGCFSIMRVHADSFSVYEIVNRILKNDASEDHQCHGSWKDIAMHARGRKMDREYCVHVIYILFQ